MVYASATQSKKGSVFDVDKQNQNVNNNNFSSETLVNINRYNNLFAEIGEAREDLQEATQTVKKDNSSDSSTSPQEKELTKQYNLANGANSFYDVIRAGNASNVLREFLGALEKQLTYYADKLGINPNSSPPTTGNEGTVLGKDNSVNETQPEGGPETNAQTSVPGQPGGNTNEGINFPSENKLEDKSATPGVIKGEELNPEEGEKGTYKGSSSSRPDIDYRTIIKEQNEKESKNPVPV